MHESARDAQDQGVDVGSFGAVVDVTADSSFSVFEASSPSSVFNSFCISD